MLRAPFLYLFPPQAEVDSVSTSLSILSLLQGNNKGGQGTDGKARGSYNDRVILCLRLRSQNTYAAQHHNVNCCVSSSLTVPSNSAVVKHIPRTEQGTTFLCFRKAQKCQTQTRANLSPGLEKPIHCCGSNHLGGNCQLCEGAA